MGSYLLTNTGNTLHQRRTRRFSSTLTQRYISKEVVMNISFSGCGFLGLYHVGVASCIKTYAPQLYLNKASGASAGSMAALALLADLPLGEMTSHVLKIATEARKCTLGPFSPSFNITTILTEGLQSVLPEDVHLKLNGRLHVSLTKVYDGKNLLVNQYSSKQEVIDVILASAFIPIFSGWLPPRYRGVRVIDGGYSDNSPIIDTNTITVSPFCGGSDICPQDDYIFTILQLQVAGTSIEMSKDNLIRLSRVLLPPDPEVLSKYCKQGFEDTLRFLQSRYLISCTRCLAVDSTYQIEKEEMVLTSPSQCSASNCLECKLQRHIAQQSSVPENVLKVFEDAIDQAEGGITGWLKTINSYRIVRLLTYPAKLPINVALNLVNRLSALQLILAHDSILRRSLDTLIEQLYIYASNGGYIRPSHKAKYTCEFNITQYGEQGMEKDPSSRESIKDILNLGFTATMESEVAPKMPMDRVSAIRFQHENMAAAVTSTVQSRVHSNVHSRPMSTSASLMGSRCNSMSSLYETDGPLPDTIGQIQQVTEHQDAVMSFYYTGQDNKLKLMEIFDVTQTDPSLLVGDDLGVNYSQDQVISQSDSDLRPHGQSQGHTRHRHSSDSAFLKNKMKTFQRQTSYDRPLFGGTTKSNLFIALYNFNLNVVGNGEEDDETDEESGDAYNFSDPEADWITETA